MDTPRLKNQPNVLIEMKYTQLITSVCILNFQFLLTEVEEEADRLEEGTLFIMMSDPSDVSISDGFMPDGCTDG